MPPTLIIGPLGGVTTNTSGAKASLDKLTHRCAFVLKATIENGVWTKEVVGAGRTVELFEIKSDSLDCPFTVAKRYPTVWTNDAAYFSDAGVTHTECTYIMYVLGACTTESGTCPENCAEAEAPNPASYPDPTTECLEQCDTQTCLYKFVATCNHAAYQGKEGHWPTPVVDPAYPIKVDKENPGVTLEDWDVEACSEGVDSTATFFRVNPLCNFNNANCETAPPLPPMPELESKCRCWGGCRVVHKFTKTCNIEGNEVAGSPDKEQLCVNASDIGGLPTTEWQYSIDAEGTSTAILYYVPDNEYCDCACVGRAGLLYDCDKKPSERTPDPDFEPCPDPAVCVAQVNSGCDGQNNPYMSVDHITCMLESEADALTLDSWYQPEGTTGPWVYNKKGAYCIKDKIGCGSGSVDLPFEYPPIVCGVKTYTVFTAVCTSGGWSVSSMGNVCTGNVVADAWTYYGGTATYYKTVDDCLPGNEPVETEAEPPDDPNPAMCGPVYCYTPWYALCDNSKLSAADKGYTLYPGTPLCLPDGISETWTGLGEAHYVKYVKAGECPTNGECTASGAPVTDDLTPSMCTGTLYMYKAVFDGCGIVDANGYSKYIVQRASSGDKCGDVCEAEKWFLNDSNEWCYYVYAGACSGSMEIQENLPHSAPSGLPETPNLKPYTLAKVRYYNTSSFTAVNLNSLPRFIKPEYYRYDTENPPGTFNPGPATLINIAPWLVYGEYLKPILWEEKDTYPFNGWDTWTDHYDVSVVVDWIDDNSGFINTYTFKSDTNQEQAIECIKSLSRPNCQGGCICFYTKEQAEKWISEGRYQDPYGNAVCGRELAGSVDELLAVKIQGDPEYAWYKAAYLYSIKQISTCYNYVYSSYGYQTAAYIPVYTDWPALVPYCDCNFMGTIDSYGNIYDKNYDCDSLIIDSIGTMTAQAAVTTSGIPNPVATYRGQYANDSLEAAAQTYYSTYSLSVVGGMFKPNASGDSGGGPSADYFICSCEAGCADHTTEIPAPCNVCTWEGCE